MFKSLFLSVVIASLFISCTEVVFNEPQPPGSKNLTEIPDALVGDYSFVVLNEQELIHITKDYFDGDEGKKHLSDSLIIRQLGNKYVINQLIDKEGDTHGKWSVYMFEAKGCGFLKATAFIISKDEYIEEFSSTYEAIQAGEGQEKQVIISPTQKQFETLTKDRDATLAIILEKIEE